MFWQIYYIPLYTESWPPNQPIHLIIPMSIRIRIARAIDRAAIIKVLFPTPGEGGIKSAQKKYL